MDIKVSGGIGGIHTISLCLYLKCRRQHQREDKFLEGSLSLISHQRWCDLFSDGRERLALVTHGFHWRKHELAEAYHGSSCLLAHKRKVMDWYKSNGKVAVYLLPYAHAGVAQNTLKKQHLPRPGCFCIVCIPGFQPRLTASSPDGTTLQEIGVREFGWVFVTSSSLMLFPPVLWLRWHIARPSRAEEVTQHHTPLHCTRCSCGSSNTGARSQTVLDALPLSILTLLCT